MVSTQKITLDVSRKQADPQTVGIYRKADSQQTTGKSSAFYRCPVKTPQCYDLYDLRETNPSQFAPLKILL